MTTYLTEYKGMDGKTYGDQIDADSEEEARLFLIMRGPTMERIDEQVIGTLLDTVEVRTN